MPAPEDSAGIQFVEADGKRSSQRAAKAVFAAAVRGVDADLAQRIEAASDWRKGYVAPVRQVVEAGARSQVAATRIAHDGLDALRRNVVFGHDGEDVSLDDAFAAERPDGFETRSVSGAGERETALVVPYDGDELRGDGLLRQIDLWQQRRVLEPSCAEALRLVVRNPGWLELDVRTFAILGASSEMGPTGPLSRWGAHIVAVDLPRRSLWDHIVRLARDGTGTLSIPVRVGATSDDLTSSAGMDLLVEAPPTAQWLASFERDMTVGNYVYADGANFVRLAAAADAVVSQLLGRRGGNSVAYLATPTDVYAVPEEVAADATSRAKKRTTLRAISRGRLYARNYDRLVSGEGGRRWGISDALMPIQGPNYALAKALQRWRAMSSRDSGRVCSANVAPASRTASVTKNRLLAAAYRGAPSFGVEIFDPATTRVLMAALLVHDLRNPQAAAQPETSLGHPFDLFVDSALHGGIWSLPYEARSILPLGLVTGLVKR
ncbi:MAG TPA: hypothetical protein VG929_10285 [Actinomycetota bacterium]|nr:hypothetical protein [Actinomycetota bacterium]